MKNFLIKKSLCLGLSLIISLSLAFQTSASNVETEKIMLEKVTNTIKDIYWQKDMGRKSDKLGEISNKTLSEDIEKYLINKISTQNYVTRLYGSEKENYNINVELIDKSEITSKGSVCLEFQVITSFNYIDCDFNSSVSELVKIVYDLNQKKIVDFYTPNNYYDIAVRTTSDDTEYIQENMEFSMTQQVSKKQDSIIQDINTVYLEESDVSKAKIMSIPAEASIKSSNISKPNVVTYARNNFNKKNPVSGNGTVPYYDFSKISGNWDCTNFVSHALLAGGAKVYDTGGSGVSSTGWYYRSLSNRSSSWSGVNQLHNYLVNNKKANKAAGISETYTHHTGQWSKGYVLQFSASLQSTSYAHSTIITKKKLSNDGERAYAYVTGRTSSSQYNDNQAASDIYPNGKKRVIFVYNY